MKFQEIQNDKGKILEIQDLSKMIEELEDLSKRIKDNLKELKQIFDVNINKLQLWINILENPKFPDNDDLSKECNTIIKDLESINIENLDFSELKKILNKFSGLKNKIEKLLKSKISIDAKKILEQLNNLDEVKENLGDKFWTAIKELSDTFDNIKIKIEWES